MEAPKILLRCRAAAFVLLLLLPGCRGTSVWNFWAASSQRLDEIEPPEPPSIAADEEHVATDANEASPVELAVIGWARATPDSDGSPRQQHWQNRQLERYAKKPGTALRRLEKDSNPVVRANAAILCASKGDDITVEELAKTIRLSDAEIAAALGPAKDLKERSAQTLALRCAAAEALGNVKISLARESLRKLYDETVGESGTPAPFYSPELHAELVGSLGKQFAAGNEPRLARALESKDAKIRLEAVLAWQRDVDHPFPRAGKELRLDADPTVRAATLHAYAMHHDAEATDVLRRAVNDSVFSVRLAAVAALGELNNDEAREELQKLKRNPSEAVRAAAVTALAAQGMDAAAISALQDKSWRVRQALADTLASLPASAEAIATETQLLAKDLVKDANTEVQQHAVAALKEWPLAQAGPALFAAMASNSFSVRREATKQLAERWPPAADFPYDAGAGQRATSLARLERQFVNDVGPFSEVVQAAAQVVETDRVSAEHLAEIQKLLRVLQNEQGNRAIQQQAIAALKQYGPELVAGLDMVVSEKLGVVPERVFAEVLPEVSPIFVAISQLQSRDLAERRRGALELARVTSELSGGKLPEIALGRIAWATQSETDPVIWQTVMSLIANDPRKTAAQLAVLAAGNASEEVRKQVATYFAAHPSDKHVQLLMSLLNDPSTPVVIEALRAIAVAQTLNDPGPLLALLASGDVQVRIEAALALSQHQLQQGTDALLQLAQETDAEVRRKIAKVMGQFPSAAYLPALIVMLSDRSEIRAAALSSLPKCSHHCVCTEEQLATLSADEQARRWRIWYDSQELRDSR